MLEIYIRDERFSLRLSSLLIKMLQFFQQIDSKPLTQTISEGSFRCKVDASTVMKNLDERNLNSFLESFDVEEQVCVWNVAENANVSFQTMTEDAQDT